MSDFNKIAHLPKPISWSIVTVIGIVLLALAFRLAEVEFRDGHFRLRFVCHSRQIDC